ncbi:helix-turn-helix transcriptional regulator [Pantoea agglomerans]|uniref:helix-turn-helix transcriptional regulator n=1 Tax=Enterobacter agglomerans TaxID=549 RepID=UPI0013C63193|nr:LuxR family transcriptional regulator [Pantoea agglomerans]NEG60608.1 LuxR family transcriptional regulator [Pantoea agglomerans]NEH05287.1 LuxR family transcriptional regulator [Pantoea agglomerans]
MDFKVVCTSENYFFQLGISKIIEEALLSDTPVQLLPAYDAQSLSQADFILISVAQWRLYMCQPAYRDRKPGSIIIVFVDEVEDMLREKLPVCYRSLITISRSDSIRNISEKIIRFWLESQECSKGFIPSDCSRCDFARITVVQLQVLSFLKKGYSVGQTAKRLNLSAKTIYAHKYNVMKKFSLRGDMEFNAFINDLSLLELYKGVIDSAKA